MSLPLSDDARIQAEAAAFRRLVGHLQQRTDVQNIDVMNLAGFCRNCLAKWLVAGAAETGSELDLDTGNTRWGTGVSKVYLSVSIISCIHSGLYSVS